MLNVGEKSSPTSCSSTATTLGSGGDPTGGAGTAPAFEANVDGAGVAPGASNRLSQVEAA